MVARSWGDEEITISTYTNDLNNILIDLCIGKVNLVGFSMGGAIALDFAIKYPSKVSSIVLMSGFSKCDSHLAGIFSKFENALDKGFNEFYDVILPMVLCPDVIQNNFEELQMIKEFSSQNANVLAIQKAIGAGLQFNIENRLPVLILAGKYDDICLLSMQTDVCKKIKCAELIVFDNVKHNLLIGKNNLKISEILQEFLNKKRK